MINCHNYESNCNGGEYTGDKSCAEGHIGALCEACDIDAILWPESYANSSEYTCGKCSVIKYNIIIIIGLTLYTVLNILLSIKDV